MNTPRLLDIAQGGGITLLHGSKSADLASLSTACSWERNPFGPAVYLTADPMVATCYTGRDGSVYRVHVIGNPRLTLDLNLPFLAQTVEARFALAGVARAHGVQIAPNSCEIRTFLFEWAETPRNRATINGWLRAAGIWMVYGELDGFESSGLCDRGVQFAVLDDTCLAMLDQYSPDDALRLVMHEKSS